MVLALSDEGADLVEPYVDEMGITVRVGAGSQAGNAFKIKGYPSSAVVNAEGKVIWQGHPSSLSKGTVEEALKGAKPRNTNMLAFAPQTAAEGRVAAHLKSVELGKLGKTHAALAALASDAKASDAEKASAAALSAEIEGHVGALLSQGERFVKSRDMLKAVLIYDTVAKEFGAAQPGADAKSKLDAIKADEKLSQELAAAEAFEKTKDSAAKLKGAKARDKWAEFAQKYKGTRAAERATALARPPKN